MINSLKTTVGILQHVIISYTEIIVDYIIKSRSESFCAKPRD
jgi:hypothetical protein